MAVHHRRGRGHTSPRDQPATAVLDAPPGARARTLRALILLAAAGSCVACGEANGSSTPSTPSPSSGAQLQVEVEVRGAVSGTAHYAQSAEAPSCAQFARGVRSDGAFVIPSGLSTASLNAEPFALEAEIDRYRGPGEYRTADFGDPTTTTLSVDLSSVQNPFEPVGAGASESASVQAGGSGSFTFNDWQDEGMRSESGTVTWTCQTLAP